MDMYETGIVEHFSKVPAFSLSDLSQLIPNRAYAKTVLARMLDGKKLMRVRKDLYTFHNDAFLIATFLLRPSYISGVSALSHRHAITQVPKEEVVCFTTKPTRRYFFVERIIFHHTKFFFGFEMGKYLGFDIPIATIEKALIDSVGHVPLSVVDEAFDDVNAERMLSYLGLIKKSSIVKRMGYLLEVHGHTDAFPMLKKYIDGKYIRLDPLSRSDVVGGKRNAKWKLVI